ncbi:Rieske (2Fe-2S) protein [Streptomyces rhizosphaericus]|uniref:Cytochrome bc1 complex Rieske iron-sulfur subunit n=1 Tax=Streptomyces rhizosphaericus TaxID=114699 RepID=A0A6G4ALD6_9ACTN|nr:Rieske (2Fe-2S) protein [Streptomyces rhizosphaericus]MBI0381171.1 Rieske (2Fe-2S) protein [Streptomyces albiflaviniger]NEW74155.1 Rieske (2Fe-2S) protein [Streptomyces rhizosphaericus]
MTQSAIPGQGTTRRAVVTAAGAAGLAATLAACGKDDDGGSGGGGADSAQDAGGAQPSQSASQSAEGGGQSGGGGGMELAKTSQIPEGGGMVFKDHKVVVTQPKAGDFKAFSSICTHQGCSVGDVSGGTINCPCHQSKFDITDGSVKGGPAQKPLPGAQIKVQGSSIWMA